MSDLKNMRKVQQIPVSELPGEDRLGDPQFKITVVANVVFVMWEFARKGQKGSGHKHAHDHVSQVVRGAVRCMVEGVAREFHAPHLIIVRAGKFHQFEALEDNTILNCVHALRKGDGIEDVIDPEDEVSTIRPISIGELGRADERGEADALH